MSRQAGIKEFFPTDKAIDSNFTSATPSAPETPSVPPAPPPVPPTPPVLATASGLVTHSAPETTSTATSVSLKRGASKTRRSEQANKRARKSSSAGDDVGSAASTDSAVPTETEFPNGPVTIWGTTRGNFCDSQEIFKSWQSGAYHKDKIIFSMYITNFHEPRDFFGRNKLITCAGGGREKKNGKGPYLRQNSKPDTVSKWEAAIDTSIFVVMGKDHPDFGNIKLPNIVRKHGVIVELGEFMVTKVWKEMVKPKGVKEPYPVWKIMLQTIDPTAKPWYWNENMQDANTIGNALLVEPNTSDTSNSTKAPDVVVEEKACESCGKSNPKIFDNAPWVCLEDECEQFFRVAGNVLSQIGDDNKELRYSKDFIEKTVIYDIVPGRSSMFQPLPEALVEGSDVYGTETALRGGMTCPKCRCCTARKYWDRLACCYCGFEYNMAPLPYPLSLVEQETKTHTKNRRVRNDGVTIKLDEDYVEQFVEDEDDGMSTRFVYMIKDANGHLVGTFVIERPSDDAKKGPGGADELYTSIEAEGGKMKFQRNPTRCPGSSIEGLTRHFQSNFGALYEFGPKGINTEPFENAPDVVLQSLVYLKHFGEKALESSQRIALREKYESIPGSNLHMAQQPFNEVLALAYRQTDKIDWHDDGEDQLTGVISTASFGSPGKMALRFKKSKKTDKPPSILEVQVRHGDVATMCDTRLQALTDHTVIPDKHAMRRYAMTSRTINFDHYRQPKEKAKLVQKGLTIDEMEKAAQIPDHALHFAYNGTTLGDQQEEAA